MVYRPSRPGWIWIRESWVACIRPVRSCFGIHSRFWNIRWLLIIKHSAIDSLSRSLGGSLRWPSCTAPYTARSSSSCSIAWFQSVKSSKGVPGVTGAARVVIGNGLPSGLTIYSLRSLSCYSCTRLSWLSTGKSWSLRERASANILSLPSICYILKLNQENIRDHLICCSISFHIIIKYLRFL